jgi:branched-subunit amino acid aminotransferase/4-amino-4-deoxychorismate lyase
VTGALDPSAARAVVDGVAVALADAALGVQDAGVARGDGAFETVGVWDGRPFRLPDHLDRLDASLRALALPPADRAAVRADVDDVLRGVTADAALRIYVTASGTRLVTLSPPPERGPLRALSPQPAPWIRPLGTYAPAGAKSMSYGPNMAATRRAVAAGADDALLVSVPDGHVLEGPTFGLLFVVDGVVHAPDVALGIVDSLSRRTLLEVAAAEDIAVRTGAWPLADLLAADEVVVSSSLRPATAVEVVADRRYPSAHPVADRLDAALRRRRRG